MPERPFTDHVIETIRSKAHGRGWAFKVWGSGSQEKGIPDILGCSPLLGGKLIGVECKDGESLGGSVKGQPTPIQAYRLEEIEQAGGLGLVIVNHAGLETLKRVFTLASNGYLDIAKSELTAIRWSDGKWSTERVWKD